MAKGRHFQSVLLPLLPSRSAERHPRYPVVTVETRLHAAYTRRDVSERIIYGTLPMTWEGAQPGPVLRVVFFRSASGREPVREWFLSLSREDRRRLGRRIKAAQYGWPIGMPVVRKLEADLWEVRVTISGGIARVVFTVDDDFMVLLHAFVKKSMKTPAADLRTARRRLALTRGRE